jgi:hypothetical protein
MYWSRRKLLHDSIFMTIDMNFHMTYEEFLVHCY